MEIKEEVRQFYDQVGWKLVSEDIYQNARYEDLRPVSRNYVHRCHMRVNQYLSPEGLFMLDAGSGPVQYPEYMAYSDGYQYRVCADISITALLEARKRLGEHGLYVAADIANLPFKPNSFDGIVSLHTIHHLPESEHLKAFNELFRVLDEGSTAVVVNSWSSSKLVNLFEPLIKLSMRLRHLSGRLRGQLPSQNEGFENRKRRSGGSYNIDKDEAPKGTFTSRHDVAWIKGKVGALMPVEIRVWRSVSVRLMRALIHKWLGGRLWLALLYSLEERFPHYFGEQGKYPMVIIRKDTGGNK